MFVCLFLFASNGSIITDQIMGMVHVIQGRPGGPDFYISTEDNVVNHGPGSQVFLGEEGTVLFVNPNLNNHKWS